MSYVLATAVNLISRAWGMPQALHPQVVTDVQTLFELQAVYVTEEQYLVREGVITPEIGAMNRWNLGMRENNTIVRMKWATANKRIILYAEQNIDTGKESFVSTISGENYSSVSFLFTLNDKTVGWAGTMHAIEVNQHVPFAEKHVDFYHPGLREVWNKLPLTLQTSVQDDQKALLRRKLE